MKTLSISVNEHWKIPDKAYVVSDAEREIESDADPDTHQLDLVHAIRDTLFKMWMYNATKN
ncbi:MAG: hypothetical protein ACP5LF_06370 [Nitrososphaeria archaeon]